MKCVNIIYSLKMPNETVSLMAVSHPWSPSALSHRL